MYDDGLTRKQSEIFDHVYSMYRAHVIGSLEERRLLKELGRQSEEGLPKYVRVRDRLLVFHHMFETLLDEFDINELIQWFNVGTETLKNWRMFYRVQKPQYAKMHPSSDEDVVIGTA